jgi:hypothetical protein
MLEQDNTDVMVDALIFFINNTANGTHTPYSRAAFSPPSFAVSVNCLFFASLSASIVAALASVVSLQWVAEYDAAVSRSGSSPEDRVKRRQFRYGGMEKWKMKEIIAALPVFLYCSLVLFFAGLAQWMWNVNSTVGGVVLGGALLGGTFYLTTTLLAVVFPSCSFRAPIVRWIYVSFHFLFHSFDGMGSLAKENTQLTEQGSSRPPFFKRFIGHLVQVWNAATSIHTYRDLILYIPSIFTHATIQARDLTHIDTERKSLVSDSLAWLAENISISSDSHDRLLLLADEASRLDEEQQLSRKFKEIPWGQIFHLLGSKYVQDAASKDLTEDDGKSLAILLRCLRNPRIGQVIAPQKTEEYSDVQPDKDMITEADFDGVDPVYLLLRNIKIPEQTLSIEQQVAVRVEFLNQVRRLPQSPREIATLQRGLTSKDWDNMLDEFIPLLAGDIELHAHENEQDRIDTLISLVHLKRPPLQNIPLQIDGYYPPLIVSQLSPLYYRLNCTNWIESGTKHRHIHSIFKALLAAQKRNPHLNLLWRFIADDEEIDTALALSSPQDRSLLADFIRQERQEMYLIETLTGLDQVVAQGCDEDQKVTIIELLCNDLAEISPNLYKSQFPEWSRQSIRSIKEPWIRLVGYAAAGIDERIGPSFIADLEVPQSLRGPLSKYLIGDRSFSDPLILPRLRMRFWRKLSVYSTNKIVEGALNDPDKLVSDRTRSPQTCTHDYRNDYRQSLRSLV